MTKLERIEQDVEKLSSKELAEFRKWFHAYDAALWDQQLERDVRSGKLERLRQQAVAEHQDQRTREL
ncbi:MAG: hypothetical protein HY288_17765 [Planctomycetia bacterium]|nr:hypothetical protein [Planctomycetia bacterium]